MTLTDEQMAELEEAERKKGAGPQNALQEIVAEPVPGAAPSAGFISDADMAKLSGDGLPTAPVYPDWESEAVDTLKGVGRGLGKIPATIDKYTAAPIRAGVGKIAGIDTPAKKPSVLSLFFPALMPGEMYGDGAPSGKQIASKMGMSEEDTIPLPLKDANMRTIRVSPAGVAGGIGETVADPLNLVGVGEAKALGKVGRLAEEFGEGTRNFARERVVKAVTGESKPNLKKFAGVKGSQMRDAETALGRLRDKGEIMLEKDPNFGGRPSVGFFDNAKNIGEEAERRRKYYGEEIGKIAPTVDRLAPGGVTPDMLSSDILELRKGLMNIGDDKALRGALAEEAENVRRPTMGDEEIGPQKPLTFADLQNMKNRYRHTPPSGLPTLSSADAESKIKGKIGQRMDDWAEQASAKPEASVADKAQLDAYEHAKERYGAYENASSAGANQGINTLNRNMLSPSSKLAAATTFIADTKSGGLTRAAQVAISAAGNQVALSRGNAFLARSADAIGRRIQGATATYQKWLPAFQAAAVMGNTGVVGLHHQLMNNDPEYRALMVDKLAAP